MPIGRQIGEAIGAAASQVTDSVTRLAQTFSPERRQARLVTRLKRQLTRGKITPEQYDAAIARLERAADGPA